jgi:hypothetical protein
MNARMRPAVTLYLSRRTVPPGIGIEMQQLSCFASPAPTSPTPHVRPPFCTAQLRVSAHFF